jgi:hypothetical protein
MAKKLGVFFIHGMGAPDEHFSSGLERRLTQGLGTAASDIAFRECWWSPIIQQYQNIVWEKLVATGMMDAKAMRHFVVNALGDPVSYLSGFF